MTIHYHIGEKGTRPWGNWEVLDVGAEYIVKRIVVFSKGKLSLQSHDFRAEHWIIAEGIGRITLGDETFDAPQDTPVYIPKGQKHRIENATSNPLIFIEVQTGKTLDENDIHRYEDVYGRT